MAGSSGVPIVVHGDQLDQHASDVKRIADEIQGQIHQLQVKVQQLGESGWKGLGSTSATEAANKLHKAGLLVSQAVGEHSQNVAKASAFYSDGENQVKNFFAHNA